jgi:hypothetical protein
MTPLKISIDNTMPTLSLRNLFAVVTIAALVLGWAADRSRQARYNDLLIEKVKRVGAELGVDSDGRPVNHLSQSPAYCSIHLHGLCLQDEYGCEFSRKPGNKRRRVNT